MRNTFSCITKTFVVIIYSLLNNKYCYYTSSRIIGTTFSCIRKIFVVVIHRLV